MPRLACVENDPDFMPSSRRKTQAIGSGDKHWFRGDLTKRSSAESQANFYIS